MTVHELESLPLQPLRGSWGVARSYEVLPTGAVEIALGFYPQTFVEEESQSYIMYFHKKANRYYARVRGAVYQLSIQKKWCYE